ncbi:hypothetical protein HX004_14695 [Myroides sp. 1354]|uniref:hypothetical protein n=1 Tax=unclassified Myroides TaxID=2642485 RepID=UPI0025761A13|nr:MULTISPECIES: hypothetical protein [unclassified Myroides]MDM1046076.1 hypothetical protein [Myroides sp. R163-1]MDM1057012.1 hypothetical protein [Myroides sp. 1354]MDM1070207.1 hypothetical protein [Myroides sp. 1372]
MKPLNFSTPTWKRAFSIAIVNLSLLFTSFTTLAQEKEQVTIKNKTLAYEITKETTASDLDMIQKEINAAKIADLKFSNVKRNAKNEIIGLTTQFKDERGSSQKKSEYNSQGIRPFAVKIHENAEGYKYLEIANTTAGLATKQTTSTSSLNDLLSNESSDNFDFGESDMMEMMKAMQESMQQQQELMQKLLQEDTK